MTLPLISAPQSESVAKPGIAAAKAGAPAVDGEEASGEAFTLIASGDDLGEPPAEASLTTTPNPQPNEPEKRDESQVMPGALEETGRDAFPILIARAGEMAGEDAGAVPVLASPDLAPTAPQARHETPPASVQQTPQAVLPVAATVTQRVPDEMTRHEDSRSAPLAGPADLSARTAAPPASHVGDAMVDTRQVSLGLPLQDPTKAMSVGRIADAGGLLTPEKATEPRAGSLTTIQEMSTLMADKTSGTQVGLPLSQSLATAPEDAKPSERLMDPAAAPEDGRWHNPPLDSAPRVAFGPIGTSAMSAPMAFLATQAVGGGRVYTQELVGLNWEDRAAGSLDSTSEIGLGERSAASVASLQSMAVRPDMPRLLAGQFAQAIRAQSGGPVEISLQPEELGRVRMTISTTEAAVIISVVAERQDTFEMMRRHATALSRELANQGFEGVELSFEQGGSGDPDQPNSGEHSGSNSHGGAARHVEDVLQIDLTHGAGLDRTKALDKRI